MDDPFRFASAVPSLPPPRSGYATLFVLNICFFLISVHFFRSRIGNHAFKFQNRKLKLIRILGIYGFSGRKLQANAEGNTDELVDPPKVEDKIGAVPNGLSTDSDVAKR